MCLIITLDVFVFFYWCQLADKFQKRKKERKTETLSWLQVRVFFFGGGGGRGIRMTLGGT